MENLYFLPREGQGFLFGKLPKNFKNKQGICFADINADETYKQLFSEKFVSENPVYTDALKQEVFMFAVDYFIRAGGNVGNAYNVNTIANLLRNMPITFFWEIK